MPVSSGTLLAGGSLLSGASSLFGGGKASSAALQAAQIQADAAKQASANQLQEFQQTRSDLAPFVGAGAKAVNSLTALTPSLTAPLDSTFNPTIGQLEATPGYQFVLDQGKKAVTSQFASQGLGGSGALGKGLVNYAEGLAGTTLGQNQQIFQQNFANQMAQRLQQYNILAGQGGLGESAAAQTGSLGTQNVTSANQLLTAGAAAQAGGVVGSANALNAGLAGAGSSAQNAALLLALNQGGLFGGAGASGTGGLT